MLQADHNGFIIAARRVNSAELINVLQKIRGDTDQILRILKTNMRQTNKLTAARQQVDRSPPRANAQTTVGTRSPVSSSPTVSQNVTARQLPRPARIQTNQSSSSAVPASREGRGTLASQPSTAQQRLRDANGRFIRGDGDGRAESSPGATTAADKKTSEGFFARLRAVFDRSGGAGNMDQIDPTVAAANEVKSLVGGAAGGIKTIGKVGQAVIGRKKRGGGDPAIPWHKRILQVLKLIRRDKSAFRGAEARARAAPLVGAASASPTPTLPFGLGGLLSGAGGGLLKLGKGLLRRIPLIGGLIAGGSALYSMFASDDPSKSPAENRKSKFTGVGGGVGSLLGGFLGMALGPIGAIVGGVIGEKVGELVGDWLSDLDWKEVGAKIEQAWDGAVKWLKEVFAPIADFFKDKIGKAADLAAATTKAVKEVVNTAGDAISKATDVVNNGVKAATGVDLKKSAANVASQATGAVKSAAVATGEKASQVVTSVQAAGGSLLETLDRKKYRHRAAFPGITGGAAMTEHGTYTDEEAKKIRDLKSSGANTRGPLKGGMPKEIQEEIIANSKGSGVDPGLMLSMAAIESGGNPNAISETGAIGIYQIVGGTASGLGVKDRFDPKQNIAGGVELAKQSMSDLKKRELPVTPENIYLYHMLGPGAPEVIRSAQNGGKIEDLSPKVQSDIAKNRGKGAKTSAEFIAIQKNALDKGLGIVAKSQTGLIPYDSVPAAAPIPTMAEQAAKAKGLPKAPIKPSPPIELKVPPSVGLFSTAAPPIVKLPEISMPKLSIPSIPSAPSPDITVRLGTPPPLQVTIANPPASQNLSDRRLAQIATGGMLSD